MKLSFLFMLAVFAAPLKPSVTQIAMQMMEAHGHQVALFSMADERGAPTPYDGYFVPHVDFKNSKQSFLERVCEFRKF